MRLSPSRISFSRFVTLSAFVILSAGLGAAATQAQTATQEKPKLEEAKLGRTVNVHKFGNIWLAGQFTPDDIDELKRAGIKTVVTLRTDGELTWDEKKLLEDAGIQYIAVPFRQPETLTDDVFDKVREILKKAQQKGAEDGTQKDKTNLLLHCGSANRVGAVWAAYRVLDQNIPVDEAIKEAKEVGLRNPGYEMRLKDYLRRKKSGNGQDK